MKPCKPAGRRRDGPSVTIDSTGDAVRALPTACPPMEDSQIRDRLAVERTRLANERTVLAYARTAVMLAASGFTVLKFAGESPGERWLGGALLIGAALVAAVGCRRFQQVHRRIGPRATDR